MANHKRDKLFIKYDDAIHSLRYHEALKIVGALYYSCASEAKEKEAQLLFLTKDYRRCIDLFKESAPITQRENELYVASLAVLNRQEQVGNFLGANNIIGHQCFTLVKMYIENNGGHILRPHALMPELDDFFSDILTKNIAIQLAEILEELSGAKILGDSGVKISAVIAKNLSRLKQIPVNDTFITQIISQVASKGFFDSNLIEAFVAVHLGHVNASRPIMDNLIPFKRFDDIIFHLDLLRRIDPLSAILDTLVGYLRPVCNEAKLGNDVAAQYLKELYIISENFHDISIDGETPIKEIWRKELEKEYPDFVTSADLIINTNSIRNLLSSKGIVAFDAATWQYQATMNDSYYLRDAGMLCLSYIRIIELELNNTIITHIRSIVDELIEIYHVERNGFISDDEKRVFDTKWTCLSSIKKQSQGIELGVMYYLFKNLCGEKDFDTISSRILSQLETLLTPEGVVAMKHGRYAEIVNAKVRERFRNPPAHTRYVNKETAFKCKEYVEKTICELYSYLQHQEIQAP